MRNKKGTNNMNVYKIRIKCGICSENLIVLAESLSRAIEKTEKRITRASRRYANYFVVDAETVGSVDIR